MKARFLVTSLGGEDVILGISWLKKENPDIDWTAEEVHLRERSIKPTIEEVEEEDVFYDAQEELDEEWNPAQETTPESSFSHERIPDLLPIEDDEDDEDEFEEVFINATLNTSQQFAQDFAKPKKTFEELVPEEFRVYKDVFGEPTIGTLPPKRKFDHGIDLKESFEPRKCKIYPLNAKEEQAMNEFIDEHLKKGTIVPSSSPQSSPFFFVGKKDGSLRPCQDYRYLNEHTVKNNYPLPLISDLLDKLKDAKIFTKMDIRWGYNNVRMKEGDQWKAAFATARGLFEPTVMFFGMCNSPATFQSMMNDIFGDLLQEGWLIIYMDDILIFSPDHETHQKRTHKVLSRLQEHRLYLKPEKCTFNTNEIEYLGMIIRPGSITMDPAKLKGISEWKTPNSVKEVRSFLGFANFYRRFIADYSTLARPLIDLTKKDVTFEWTIERQKTFEKLKKCFTTAPVLQIPDKYRQFAIATDASLYATGGVLLQKNSNGEWLPCSFISQSFNPAERNYQIYDRELLGIVRALKAWRHYLLGSPYPVIVYTDHKNLQYFRDVQDLNRRQARWQTFLSQFELSITHVPGKDLIVPDLLSRRSDHLPDDYVEKDNTSIQLLPDSLFVNVIDTSFTDRLRISSSIDPVVQTALKALTDSSTPPPLRSALSDWKLSDRILTYKGLTYVPPGELRHELTSLHHDSPTAGHPGRFKTQELLSRDYWWPGLSTFVKNYVDGCCICQQNKVNTHPSSPPLNPIPAPISNRPFSHVSVDLITDLPLSDGYDSIMVVVDHGLSKGVILTPCHKTIDAEGVANIFFSKVFSRYGLYDKIISDRGPQFASRFQIELGRLLGYKNSLSTAFHPQSDGETERVNQELEVYLRIYCANDQTGWAPMLPLAEFVHNSRHHSARGTSPFYLMMGYHPRHLPDSHPKSDIPNIEQRLSLLNRARDEALAAHELARNTMKQRITSRFVPFAKGDKVWLEAKNLNLGYPNRKLAPKREGPFTIIDVLSPITYRLALPSQWRIHPVFHAALLSPYKENDTHGPNFIAPPPDIIDGEEEQEIEAIVAHRGSSSRRSYYVKWKGFPSSENEWMTERQLGNAPDILSDYKSRFHL